MGLGRAAALLLLLVPLPACGGGGSGFDLSRPVATVELPRALREVSAITALDADTLACVQDEKGTIYLVDVATGKIRGREQFGKHGDYEGLCRVGDDFWVLRSDGLLIHLRRGDGEWAVRESLPLELPFANLEGLGHDAAAGRLLIAPKDIRQDGKEERDLRPLYAFDLATRRLLPEPVLVLSVRRILQQAVQLGIELPTRRTQKGREVADLRLRLSSVEVCPHSGHLFLLSSQDHALLVVDRTGRLLDLHFFPKQELPKAEGLTFLPGGDLLIASEAVDGPPLLQRYRRVR